MADDEFSRPVRLMNFVSQEQLDEAKRTRGERVEDGTAQRDRPLYEILKENKDKKDAEFNERFKHRPPKALDEDETEFLDNLETSKKEYEQQMADEEAEQLRSFQAAVAAQSSVVNELKEEPPLPSPQEQKPVGKKNPPSRPLSMIIKVKPQAKKQKIDGGSVEEPSATVKLPDDTSAHNSSITVNVPKTKSESNGANNVAMTGLVSYSDESEDDD